MIFLLYLILWLPLGLRCQIPFKDEHKTRVNLTKTKKKTFIIYTWKNCSAVCFSSFFGLFIALSSVLC